MFVFAQILALIAIITWVISILLKKKKDILLMQVIANGIYGLEYLLLNALSAAGMNFLSFIRLLIYYFYAKNNIYFMVSVFICVKYNPNCAYRAHISLSPILRYKPD